MRAEQRALLQIHVCVLLWGFTAILGKLITLTALQLVWWRLVLVVAALAVVPHVWRTLDSMSPRLRLAYSGIGLIVAAHWLTFYGAIKLANASVGAACIALATPLTALVEPLITRSRFSHRDLLLGVAVLPGVALVVGGVPVSMRIGIGVGAVSALLVAVFGSLNKRLVHHGDPLAITVLELGAGALGLTALGLLLPSVAGTVFVLPAPRDAMLLALLALACTLLPYALSLVALRHMSAFAAQLAVNLEPVYAIALAIVLLNEQRELGAAFYAGVAIILGAVLVHPLLSRPRHAAAPELLAASEAKRID